MLKSYGGLERILTQGVKMIGYFIMKADLDDFDEWLEAQIEKAIPLILEFTVLDIRIGNVATPIIQKKEENENSEESQIRSS